MVSIWLRSETFTHGFFVAPIVFWLIWRQRVLISTRVPQVNFWVLIPLLGIIFFWSLGDLAFVNSVTQLCVVALLVLLVPAIFGWAITSIIIFPLFFLFFSVPLGEFLFPQLMEWTANFTVFALRLSGVPVYREGLQFVIPSGNWSVVEACSGVRYLIASLTVGTLFAYLNYQSFRRRVFFILISIIVPIFANWIRAYLIVMLGHFSGNKLAVGVDHIIYGWLFFGLVIVLMFMAGARWAEPSRVVELSVGEKKLSSEIFHSVPLIALSCFLIIIISLPWLVQKFLYNKNYSYTSPSETSLVLKTGWVLSPKSSCAELKPVFKNASLELNNCYSNNENDNVGLYIGYYHEQSYDKKLVSSDNVLVASNDRYWAPVGVASGQAEAGPIRFPVKATELRDTTAGGQLTDARLLVWQVYWINGILTKNDHLAKIYSVLQRLLGHKDDSAVIILYTEKKSDGKSVFLLNEFLNKNFDVVDKYLKSGF
ncbi:exosortase A [Rhodoferax sp. OV413]|nr:exosortase A [Rhodoferax sp. OV413]